MSQDNNKIDFTGINLDNIKPETTNITPPTSKLNLNLENLDDFAKFFNEVDETKFDEIPDGDWKAIVDSFKVILNEEKKSRTVSVKFKLQFNDKNNGRFEIKNYVLYSPKMKEETIQRNVKSLKTDLSKFGMILNFSTLEKEAREKIIGKEVLLKIETTNNEKGTWRNVSIKPKPTINEGLNIKF